MDIKEAYSKVEKLPNRNVLLECIDLGDRWAFYFHHMPVGRNEGIVGGGYDVVHKTTGKLTSISTRPENWGILESGKPINVRQFEKGKHRRSKLETFLANFFNRM